MTLSSQSIKKKKRLLRETPSCLCKVAKCIEMQLKIVNDFLTEIYIFHVQWTLKLFSFVDINKQINKDPFMVPGHFRVPKTLTFKMRLGAQPFF